jgi:cell wall-associated NlpC family hydrolase
MTTPAEVVATVRAWIGTPWRHQGRSPGLALDCAGLVICAARQLGMVPPDWDKGGYWRSPDGSMQRLCGELMTQLAEPELGAVLLIAVDPDARGARAGQHIGVVGDYRHGGHSLIHAASATGKVIEHRLMVCRTLRVLGAYRLPGVAA